MKVNLFGLRPGTAINRQYNNIRIGARVKGCCAGGFLFSAAMMARQRNLLGTIFGTGMGFIYMKELEFFINRLRELRPEYNQIVERAKRIYSKS